MFLNFNKYYSLMIDKKRSEKDKKLFLPNRTRKVTSFPSMLLLRLTVVNTLEFLPYPQGIF
jgi:hypothetical protein